LLDLFIIPTSLKAETLKKAIIPADITTSIRVIPDSFFVSTLPFPLIIFLVL